MHEATEILPGVIMSAGYDWITASGAGSVARSRFLEIGDSLVVEERNAARGERAASRFGYDGWAGDHWFFGSRKDGLLIVVSSGRAVLAGKELIAAATNVSRLDLQVTYALDWPIVDLAAEAFNTLQSRPTFLGRPFGYTLIHSQPKGQTLNVCKRVSDSCGRLYDKGVESNLCGAGQLWRWELELKRRRAHSCALASLEHTNLATYSAGCVKAFFCSKGLEPAWTDSIDDLASQPAFFRRRSDSLDWFRNIVSVSVRRAVNQHGCAEVVKALGLDQLVQVNSEVVHGR